MKRWFRFSVCGGLFLLPLLFASDLSPALERAQRVYAAGRLSEAVASLQHVLPMSTGTPTQAEIEQQLGVWNLELLLSPHAQPECLFYTVEVGDSLEGLARRYGTTEDLLRKINRIPGDTLRLGRRIKILQQPFRVEVDKSENSLVLWLGGRFFKRYVVATGRDNHTPSGTWHIVNRIVHPLWTRPSDGAQIPYGHPEHRIGTHWLGWDKAGFGIHGTSEPESLGRQASSGCVRMHNEEVAELYMLLPLGTEVWVSD